MKTLFLDYLEPILKVSLSKQTFVDRRGSDWSFILTFFVTEREWPPNNIQPWTHILKAFFYILCWNNWIHSRTVSELSERSAMTIEIQDHTPIDLLWFSSWCSFDSSDNYSFFFMMWVLSRYFHVYSFCLDDGSLSYRK
jgi:hypothetical protein